MYKVRYVLETKGHHFNHRHSTPIISTFLPITRWKSTQTHYHPVGRNVPSCV